MRKLKIKKKNKTIKSRNFKSKYTTNFLQKTLLFKFTLKHFLSANAHLGYETGRWNPQIKNILWGSRNNTHVLDMEQTVLVFKRVFATMILAVKSRKLVLFASENKYIDHVLTKLILLEKQAFSSNRWIGGIITNFKAIRQNITLLTTRYASALRYLLLTNRKKRLKASLEGLIYLSKIPSFVIILNGVKSKWTINEIISKNILCVAIVDSIASKQFVPYLIPGNVYGFATQILYVKLFQNVIRTARFNEILKFKKLIKISKRSILIKNLLK